MSTPLNAAIGDLFDDPISYERMRNPVITTCGHTFERIQIEGWIALHSNDPSCPTCRAAINTNDLVPNLLIRQAIEILNNPSNRRLNRVDDLRDDNDRQRVETAASHMRTRRAADEAAGNPYRLPEPMSFIQATMRFYSQSCRKSA